MKWTNAEELQLVLLALAQAPRFSIDADKIRQSWQPADSKKPSVRAVKERMSKLRKDYNVKFSIAVTGTTATSSNPPTATAVNGGAVTSAVGNESSTKIKYDPHAKVSTTTTALKNRTIATPTKVKTKSGVKTPQSNGSNTTSSTKKRKFVHYSEEESTPVTEVSSEEDETEATESNAEDEDDNLISYSTPLRRQLPVRQSRQTNGANELFKNLMDEEDNLAMNATDSDEYDPWIERESKIRAQNKANKRSRRFVLGDEDD